MSLPDFQFDGQALKVLAAVATTLATRVGKLGGVERVAFFKSLCAELMLDAHQPVAFVRASVSARSSVSSSRANMKSAAAPASLSDADLDALLTDHSFPARFPVVAAPSTSMNGSGSGSGSSWPAVMYDIPGVLLGDYVYQCNVGTEAASLRESERPVASSSIREGGNSGSEKKSDLGAALASARQAWVSWDGALIGPPVPLSGADHDQRAAGASACTAAAAANGGSGGAGLPCESFSMPQSPGPRACGRLERRSPVFVVKCASSADKVAPADLCAMAETLRRDGPHDCQLLFVVARSFSKTAPLAKAAHEFGMNLLVLRCPYGAGTSPRRVLVESRVHQRQPRARSIVLFELGKD